MNQGPVRASELDAALRRVRLGVLATLAVSAAVSAAITAGEPAAAPAGGFPIAAIALGLGSVFARHAAVAARSRARILFALALQGGPRNTALAYALGGALLCLRPVVRPAPR